MAMNLPAGVKAGADARTLRKISSWLWLGLLFACDPGARPKLEPVARSASVTPPASAIRTASDFKQRLPSSTTLTSADGTRLLHASGFSVETGLARAEDAAAAFLAEHGAAFGVTDRHELAPVGRRDESPVAAVHVSRSIGGLPVFGGDLVVGVAHGRVFLLNAADVPATTAGFHVIGPELADAVARSALGRGNELAATARVAAGWRPFLGVVRPVYRVDLVTATGDWRVWVDGETGSVPFREDLRFRATAPGTVYEVSPVETAASLCPLGGNQHTACASPVAVTFDHLIAATSLAGSQTGVWNCRGGSAPQQAGQVTTACSPVAPVSGSFTFPPDATGTSAVDDFAAAMAYYHLDRHVSFLKALDPALPGDAQNPPSQALNGSLPALVNVTSQGPLDNAYFSGVLDAMVFGQGTSADFAYDATVMYHEFTHGVVYAWGGFNIGWDARGGLDEPSAVNEGTADALAVSVNGRSAVGAYVGPGLSGGAVLRDMADPAAARTCRGNGTLVNQLGASNVVNGLDGEVHDDGEIWNGFYWEVYQGLKAGGWRACNGSCDAGPAIQYAALKLSAGTSPTFATSWASMRSAAAALFPANPEVATYVECVARRRAMDQCDRTVPLYRGESKVQFVRLRYSPFQISFTADASGTGSVALCSVHGTSTTVYLRKGEPVVITALDPQTLEATVTADAAFMLAQPCQSGTFSLYADASDAGTWYIMFDSPSALGGSNPGSDKYKVTLSGTGMTSRPAAPAPPTCTPPVAPSQQPLTISPASATVAPSASRTFTASGGSGTGYTWSLQTNASGGAIHPSTGVYTAGATGNVTDVVRVRDSANAIATANVTVTGTNPTPLTISPASATVAPNASRTFTASGGSGTGYTWSLPTNASGGAIHPSTGVYTAGATGNVTDVVRVRDSANAIATANVTVTGTNPTPLTISPASAAVAASMSLTFTASGGSGTGYTWSLPTNASGGTIDPSTGVYTAGAAGNVTDVVRVRDSANAIATANVTVIAGASGGGGSSGATGGGGGGGCATVGGSSAFSLLLAAAALARRARRPTRGGAEVRR